MRSVVESTGRVLDSGARRRWPFLVILGLVGCVSTQVSNLDVFEVIEMNRVVPYPSAEELAERSFEVLLIDRGGDEIEASRLEAPRRRVHAALKEMVAGAGAVVTARRASRFGGLEESAAPRAASEIDYTLGIRFVVYDDTAVWKPPMKFLWQSPEEVADREGTCIHRADVAMVIDVEDVQGEQRPIETYLLRHAAERKSKHLDESCPLDPDARDVLYELALDEALSCLRAPFEEGLAPRGHVLAHRWDPETNRHIYQISLGTLQGMEFGRVIEIRREQHASTPRGESWRSERIIATGFVTDQLTEDSAWVAIDPQRATDEILKGDVARRALKEGLLSSLSGPDCRTILEKREPNESGA